VGIAGSRDGETFSSPFPFTIVGIKVPHRFAGNRATLASLTIGSYKGCKVSWMQRVLHLEVALFFEQIRSRRTWSFIQQWEFYKKA
jgi:hypothetical protein